MAEKDTRGMTASELLRYCYDRGASCSCTMCHAVLNTDRCEGHECRDASAAIADKIDAELAHVRASDLRDLAAIWATTNGWPGFREGEVFGAWLERCSYKKPVDDHNEPVQFGDEIELHFSDGGMEKGRFQGVTAIDGPVWVLSFTGVHHERPYRYDSEYDTIKRPTPEVLGADGKPIKAGDTVWHEDGTELRVDVIMDEGQDNGAGFERMVRVTYVSGPNDWAEVCAMSLSHTPPDTQEGIDGDVEKDEFEYWGCVGCSCVSCPALIDGDKPWQRYDAAGCEDAMVLDLLRRQRELDARKGGAE